MFLFVEGLDGMLNVAVVGLDFDENNATMIFFACHLLRC
jgi:hypothetical protein